MKIEIKTKITEGLDLFLCTKLSCWLTMERCLFFQKRASLNGQKMFQRGISATDGFKIHCSNCEEGREIQKITGVKITKEERILTCKGCGFTGSEIHFDSVNGLAYRRCKVCKKKKKIRDYDNSVIEKKIA